jgi:hypothetical protein
MARCSGRVALLFVALVGVPPLQAEEPARLDRHGDVLPDGAVARLGSFRLRYHRDLTSMALSPDAKRIATLDWGGAIKLWDAVTGPELHTLKVPRNILEDQTVPAFSPDNRMLALAVLPHSRAYINDELQGGAPVHLWELSTGLERRKFLGHREPVSSLAFSPDGRFLVSGSEDTTLLVWDMKPSPGGRAGGGKPTAADLDAAWTNLADTDAAFSFEAIRRLAAWREDAVPLLQRHLRPVEEIPPERLRRLLAELDSEEFAVRERAERELRSMPETVAPPLRKALSGQPSREVARRVERILPDIEGTVPCGDRVRSLRGVEVLEIIGTAEARKVLEALAAGSPKAQLTLEAKASLGRLAGRSAR